MRAIGYARRNGLTLHSRNDRDISRSYPEVAALDIEPGVIVDGELVAFDGHGRPDFGLLQHRITDRRADRAGAGAVGGVRRAAPA